MAGRERAINMPLRLVGLDGVKRDFAEMGRSGSDALNDIGKTAEKAFRNSELSIQRMKKALEDAKAIAARTYDASPHAASLQMQQSRRGFIREQLRTAKAGIAEDARAFGAAAQAKAAEAALSGADEAAGRFGLSLGRLGGAGGIAAAGIGLAVTAAAVLASKTDEETKSLERFTTQLALAGNGSGLTAAQLAALGSSASAASGQTVDAIRQAEAAIINMPGVTGPAFDAVIESAARLAGKLGTDVASEAEKAGAVVSAIATQDMAALEKAIANLDPVLQNAILKLVDAGKTSEATAVYLKALAEAAGDGPSGLTAETNKLTNSWSGMLAEWGRTTGIAGAVEGAMRGIGSTLDWLKAKADIAGPAIMAVLAPGVASFGPKAPGAGGQLQTPNWIQDDRAWRDQRRQQAAQMGLADRALAEQLKGFGRTQAERKKQADVEFARTKLARAGLGAAEVEARAQRYAAQAEAARAAAAAREPGAIRRRQSAAERAARAAESARQRGVRNQQQFDQQSATLDSALIAAKRANTTDAEQLAKFARDQIATETEKTADTIRSREKLRQYTAAQAAELLAKNEQVKAEKLKTVDTNLAREVARDALALATARIDNDSALLKLQEPMARTAAAQRALQLKQLDFDVRKERLALESTVALGKAGDVDVEIAKAKLRILDQLKAGEAAAIKLSTQGPLEEYWSSLPRTIDEVGEAMERVRVDQLRKLNDDTREFADTFSGALGRAAGDLARFKNPWEIGRNLLGDMADLFTRQFVENPVTEWARRKAGGPIAERLVGGMSGDYGLNAQQMNAAMSGTTVELNAFSLALQQARMSVGPAALGVDPLAALPAANDNLDALAGESAAAAAALRAQLPTIGQFGTGLAQVLSMLGGGAGGGIGGLAGLILGIAGSAFGGGTTSAGTGVVYGGNLGGIYHTGTRGRGVGPGGARRSIGAADIVPAPRIPNDEFVSLLRRDEDVLSPWQSSALRDFMSNGGRPANDGPQTIMPVVNINAPQPAPARRVGAVVGRSVQLAAGRAGRKGLAAPKRAR